MNGRDDADARCDAQYKAELHGLMDWIKETLVAKRAKEPLTPFEVQLLNRVEKIGEM